MDTLLQDLRFALRFLRRNYRSSLIAVLCLGTGIAMTTGTYSSVSPWVTRPLPWHDPEQLVALGEVREDVPDGIASVSVPDYRDWVRESTTFERMAAFERANFNFSIDDEPQLVLGARISASLFSIFGDAPALGRGFSVAEDESGRGAVVILSHEIWQQRFGGSRTALGQSLRIDGLSHEIIGVMPPGYAFPEWAKAWTPLGLSIGGGDRDVRRLSVVARMRQGVTIEQARADMDRVSRALQHRHPDANAGWKARVLPYRDQLVPSGIRIGLSIQLFASIFVLVIACGNAANILLAQAASREREIAVRTALGASRARIVRQLLTEAMLIGLVSGGIGVVLAQPLMDGMLRVAPVEPPYWVDMTIDLQVLLFTVGISLLTGIGFGLVPALRASRSDLVGCLKEGGRSATRGVRGQRLARGLVVGELALSITLLIAAMLSIRSYMAIGDVDLGYDRDGVLTWRTTLSSAQYSDHAARARFVREMVRRVAAIPGVEAAGAVNFLPAQDGYWMRPFEIEGQPTLEVERPSVDHHPITEGYLDTLRIEVLEGRAPRGDELEHARPVVLVSQSMARRFWPTGSALGQRIRFEADSPWLRIIGITRDVRAPFDVVGASGSPKWQSWAPITRYVPVSVSFALRTWGSGEAMAPAVRREFRAVDPNLPLYDVFSMDEVLLRVIWVSRMWGIMFGGFAVFALLLSSVGLYGVISYGVEQRRHEVGVRLALGARPADVLKLVMKQGLQTTLLGAALGLTMAVGLAQALSGQLFGIEIRDPLTFVGMTLLLSGVALLATFFPALRATRLDPVIALREG